MTRITFSRATFAIFCLYSSAALTGCKSADEKAEEYYVSGLSYLQAGDEDRAMIEFRNVFNYDGFHKEARHAFADILLKRGDTTQAYSQYLRLIEQYPDTLEARQRLAEMAMRRNDWTEVKRHGEAAIALGPNHPRSKAIDIALRYRRASIEENQAVRKDIAEEARTLLANMRTAGNLDDNEGLVRVDLDDLINRSDTAGALAAVSLALLRNQDALDLNMMKAQFLSQLGDTVGTGAQLKMMAAKFPDNEEVQQNLIRWYLSEEDSDGAVTYLRKLAGPQTGDIAGHMNLIHFLESTEGPDATRTELTALRNANSGTEKGRLYAGMLANLTFETGQTESGISQMRLVLDSAENSEQTRSLQVILAQMLATTGDRPGAQALVETILTQDTSNINALKLQASWLISDDKIGEAIVALRTALNQNPQDSETLTLMAQAHLRDGDLALAGQRLALAVEMTNAAPAESLRYANFLAEQNRLPVAITVLEDARRRAPANIDVLTALADFYLKNRDWAFAQRIVDDLRKIDVEAAQKTAPLLQAAIMQGQNRTADSLAVLETQVDPVNGISDRESARAVVLIVQTQIRSGKIDEARTYLDNLLRASPENANLQMLDASLSTLMGDTEAAEGKYRALADRFPKSDLPVRLLVGILLANGSEQDASALIEKALPIVENRSDLLLLQASMLEKGGKLDDAIAVYEKMYADDSGNVVIANNLASLIATHRDDAKSLERANVIARRLRDTDVPAFQDTYGWIAFRRGSIDEALQYLVPAAAGLPNDPMVQFHVGMTYAAAGQIEKAKDSLTQAIEMSAESRLPQFQLAREKLADIAKTAGNNP